MRRTDKLSAPAIASCCLKFSPPSSLAPVIFPKVSVRRLMLAWFAPLSDLYLLLPLQLMSGTGKDLETAITYRRCLHAALFQLIFFCRFGIRAVVGSGTTTVRSSDVGRHFFFSSHCISSSFFNSQFQAPPFIIAMTTAMPKVARRTLIANLMHCIHIIQ